MWQAVVESVWQADALSERPESCPHIGLAVAGSHRLLSSVPEGSEGGESGEICS